VLLQLDVLQPHDVLHPQQLDVLVLQLVVLDVLQLQLLLAAIS
jgi:hypothetical protein